jgi:CheY-like chemotaxis protein
VHTEGQEAIACVQDTGCGIAPDKLSRAFEAFSQMSESQVREGSGLGLAVSKKFVELHGGRMWLESKLGQGTTVSFSLSMPCDGKEVRISPLVPSGTRRLHRGEPRVLVIHDDARTLDVLRRHIRGCQFVLGDTPQRAELMIREQLPAMVLTDAALREDAYGPASSWALPAHVPVVTCPLPSMRRIGLLLGAADYLPKPVTRKALSDALARLPRPPKKVLVVDDDAHIVRLLARMLRAYDSSLQVLEAFSGKEALEVARARRPDVILLDLYMPEMSGYDLLEALSCDGDTAGTQVIIVSVRAVEQESRPIQGEIRVTREEGFTLSEILEVLQATVTVVTQSGAVRQASAVPWLEAEPG